MNDPLEALPIVCMRLNLAVYSAAPAIGAAVEIACYHGQRDLWRELEIEGANPFCLPSPAVELSRQRAYDASVLTTLARLRAVEQAHVSAQTAVA